MKSKDILNGSKLIAEYLGWRYIPHNDLQGFPRAGWFEVRDNQRAMLAKYAGWVKVGDLAVRFVCRKHSDLRFWNSLDTLIPAIQKIEKEEELHFELLFGGCILMNTTIESFDESLRWSNNVFKVIVEYLKTR